MSVDFSNFESEGRNPSQKITIAIEEYLARQGTLDNGPAIIKLASAMVISTTLLEEKLNALLAVVGAQVVHDPADEMIEKLRRGDFDA